MLDKWPLASKLVSKGRTPLIIFHKNTFYLGGIGTFQKLKSEVIELSKESKK